MEKQPHRERTFQTTKEDGFEIKTFSENEFLIQSKEPYAGRHFFVEEDFELIPDLSSDKQNANKSPSMVFEVAKKNKFPAEIRYEEKKVEEKLALFEDFGCSNDSPHPSQDHSDLRLRLLDASRGYDEQLLSDLIDEARLLGSQFTYTRDIERSEQSLFQMTCGDHGQTEELMKRQSEHYMNESQDSQSDEE